MRSSYDLPDKLRRTNTASKELHKRAQADNLATLGTIPLLHAVGLPRQISARPIVLASPADLLPDLLRLEHFTLSRVVSTQISPRHMRSPREEHKKGDPSPFTENSMQVYESGKKLVDRASTVMNASVWCDGPLRFMYRKRDRGFSRLDEHIEDEVVHASHAEKFAPDSSAVFGLPAA